MKHGGETVGRRPVFCLIALGDARGHETGKQGNRSADPGQGGLPNLRASGSGRIDTEVCNVTAGARSTRTTAPPGRDHPHNLAGHKPHAPRAATFTPSRRSASTTAAASSAAAIGVGWPSSRPGRRLDDQRIAGCPAASCASRSGNRARMARCRSAVASRHSPISATVRPQPVQSPARASSAQTSTHGDSGASVTPSP